jgi:hypothetical protein
MSNTLLGGDFPDMEKLADTSPVVPTPKKNPKAIEFAFKCSENKWAATNFSIAKFDLADWPVASAPLLPPSGSQPSSRLSAVSPSIIESRLLTPLIHRQTGKPLFIVDASTPLGPVNVPERLPVCIEVCEEAGG